MRRAAEANEQVFAALFEQLCRLSARHLPLLPYQPLQVRDGGCHGSLHHHTPHWTGVALGNGRVGAPSEAFSAFAAELRKVFALGNSRSSAARQLLAFRQGERSVSDYSIDFRTLASRSKWSPAALVYTFLHGLAAYIKDALVAYEVPGSLDGAIELAIWVDLRVQARLREKRQMRQLAVADK
ncbi:hypothetical protein D4764_14G0004190, partial [Takifugu flavidus]